MFGYAYGATSIEPIVALATENQSTLRATKEKLFGIQRYQEKLDSYRLQFLRHNRLVHPHINSFTCSYVD